MKDARLMRTMFSGLLMRHCPSSRTREKVRVTVEAATRVSTPDASMLATPSTETVTSTSEPFSDPAVTAGAVSVS